ncbi:MAG: hypothetical protein NT010_11950 [Proteobacteria bacterium]|nr:hypothetical protein [Pseudomonadota bacterium]
MIEGELVKELFCQSSRNTPVKEYNITDFHPRNKKDDILVYKTLQNNCLDVPSAGVA